MLCLALLFFSGLLRQQIAVLLRTELVRPLGHAQAGDISPLQRCRVQVNKSQPVCTCQLQYTSKQHPAG